MTTFKEIINRLEGIGLPVAHMEFKDTKRKPAPDPPFACYLVTERQRGSDQRNLIKEFDGSIELYTDRDPDPEQESKIEEYVLFDLEFEKEQVKIDAENMVMTSYDFTLVQKGKVK